MSSVSWRSRLGSVRRPPLWGLWLLTFVAWARIWSFHWLSNDDLNFAARAHRPPGPLSPSSIVSALHADITRRNGRTADVLAGIILNAHPVGITIILALLCTLAGAAAWRWTRLIAFPSKPSRLADILLAASCAAAPLAVTVFNPRHSRETIYFLAATIGYLVGPLLFFLATGPLVRQVLRGGVPRWRLYASLPLAVAAAYHHEVFALMLAGTVFGCVLLWRRDRWTVHTWAIAASLLVIVAVKLSAPGLWARSNELSGGYTPEPVMRLSYVVRSATGLIQSATLLFTAMTVGLLLVGLTSLRRADGRRRVSLTVATTAIGALGIAALLTTDRAQVIAAAHPRGAIHTYPSSLAVLATLLLYSAVLLCLSWLADRTPEAPPSEADGGARLTGFTVLAGVLLGSLAIPFAMGGGSGRSTYLGDFVMVLLAAAAGCFAIHRHQGSAVEGGTRFAIAVIVACMTPAAGLQAWTAAQPGLKKNHKAWNEILRQIEDAKAGKTTEVKIPAAPPAPAYAGDWPSQTVSPYAFRVLYDVPDHVTIKVVKTAKTKR